jgi:predicted HTH transcriptional regulator
MDADQVIRTVETVRAFERENEWVELKHNNSNPEDIGEYISAIANSAALMKEPAGLIIWGIEDATHEIVGTNSNPTWTKLAMKN